MKRLNITLLTAFLLLQVSLPTQAEDSPLVLMESTTSVMIDEISKNRDALRNNPLQVNELVERVLLPHIDFISASRWVLGKYWRTSDKQQKIRFIREFRTLLVKFYSTALVDFLNKHQVDHKMIRFLPQRGEAGNDTTIRSEVTSPDGKVIPVNYYLHKTQKGWKVYDVSVEGVSMVTTYRTSFASEIKQKGVDGLIASLAEKNKSL